MTRDELIERHAQETYVTIDGKSTIEACRRFARHNIDDLWPLVVEFVADWLANYDGPAHSAHPDIVAKTWREEMGVGDA